MSHKPPCKFFNLPSGCRFGTNCKFAHTQPTTTRASSPASTTSRGATRNSQQRATNRQSNGGSTTPVPPGACRVYWTSGKCNKEFQCRFRHVQNTSNVADGSSSSSAEKFKATVAPFLTQEGLNKLGITGTDGFFSSDEATSLDPSVAQSRLRRFLFDDYQFKTVFDVYAFVTILASANTTNKLWVRYMVSFDLSSSYSISRLKRKAR
jgi:hypothetical protein